MIPIHPGRILKREIAARGISADGLARALGLPAALVTDVLEGKRGICPDMARRLGRLFGNSTDFWLNLQSGYGTRN